MAVLVDPPGPAVSQSMPRNLEVVDPAWLRADTETNTANFSLIAGLTGLNGALNFNGFRDGGLTLTVPLGWTVSVHFRNHDGMLAHSAEVIPDVQPVPTASVPPAFDRAYTIRLTEGIPPEGEDDFRLVADKVGSFLIFCAVPGHGATGMWIRIKVSGSVREPAMAATPAGKS